MRRLLRCTIVVVFLLVIAVRTDAEVLVRWTERHVPPPDALGVRTLLVPASNRDALREALRHGYRVYVELPASAAATLTRIHAGLAGVVVTGTPTRTELAGLRQQLGAGNVKVLTTDEQGKWPHIRANWVMKNNEVLQVAGRSAQPWIDSNAALVRIANAEHPDHPPLLIYDWTPSTEPAVNQGPALENYLVAIAEAESLGADLVLPLHGDFQRRLLRRSPAARGDWSEIRRYLDFYSGDLPRRYAPITSIGVMTSRPMIWFEVMNLLARHNLPFEVIAPSQLRVGSDPPPPLILVFDELDARQSEALAELERKGSIVRRIKDVPDPNAFALEMRKTLGPGNRVVDIWNGLTVLVAPYTDTDGGNVLLTMINYAHQPLPVQLRVRGTFSRVHYETPDAPAAVLPHESRDGYTEVTVPSLRVGGRLFFSR